MELYEERLKEKGKQNADLKFVIDVLLLFRPGIIKPTEGHHKLNTYGMYKSFFKIGWRTLSKSKVHSFIIVGGLALGIASVFLMTMYVKHELGYDQYYDQPENLYRIIWENENPQTRTPHPMAQALVNDFPEVESAVSLSPLWASGLTRRILSFRNPENNLRFDEANVLVVDTTFFDVFRFPVVRGDARKALRNVNGILISESTASRYFGNEDPIGKQLAVNTESSVLEVMAIFKDVPHQSHFHFDMLISYVREKSLNPDDEYYTWNDFGHFNYVRLKSGADPRVLEAKLMPWVRKYINVSDEYFRKAIASNIGFRIQPITDIHLKSHLRWELEANGNLEYVLIMATAALLTLIIACINFMNLMTAKSIERAKEIGVRKTMGALRRHLSFQFLIESMLVTLIAIVIAVLLVQASLPFYNDLTGHAFILNYREAIPMLTVLSILVALIAGIYPSFFLSSVQPTAVIRGKFQHGGKGSNLRNALIVFQFAISMILISGSAIIFSQLDYIQNKNLGFDKEEVLVIPIKNKLINKRLQTLKSELLKLEGVNSVSASSNLPGGQFNQNAISLVDAPEHEIDCSETFIEYDFLKAMNIDLMEGRFFLPENFTDSTASFVINETAARQLSNSSVVGREINWHAYENDNAIQGRIIGVVKDFHFQSVHQSIQPLIFILYPSYNHLIIKIDPKDFETTIEQIKDRYTQLDEAFDFEFSFLDEHLHQQYRSEQRIGVVFGAFAFIAITIACFGLFGMAMLTFHQRSKEVSIRKVLGAPLPNLIVLLLGDFTKLILFAILIALPIAWWMMSEWLDNFIYQVGIHPAVFLISGMLLILSSWITLSYLTFKVSRINPIEALKE